MNMMMTSPEQMKRLSRAAYNEFENRMVAHLREFFPDQCEELSEDGVRDEIKYGVRRAKLYGFESEQDVCRYIDLMFAFGSNFDADPDLVELRQLLDDDVAGDPTERMDCLYDVAMSILEAKDAAHSKSSGT